MGKGLPRALSRKPAATPGFDVMRITGTAVLDMDGASGNAIRGVKIRELPEGCYSFLGLGGSVTITGPGSGHTSTFDVFVGIGTIAGQSVNFSGDDGAIGGVSLAAVANVAGPAGLNKEVIGQAVHHADVGYLTENAVDVGVWLNVAIPDASISANNVNVTVDYDVHIAFCVLPGGPAVFAS